MPSKTKLKNAAVAAKSAALPKIPKELLVGAGLNLSSFSRSERACSS